MKKLWADRAWDDYLYWQMSSMAASYNALMRKEKGSNTYYTKYTINVDYFISLEQEQMLTQELNIINDSFGFTETTTDNEKLKIIDKWIKTNKTPSWISLETTPMYYHPKEKQPNYKIRLFNIFNKIKKLFT